MSTKKKEQVKHTPLPWSVVLTDHPDNGDDCWGIDAESGSVGFCEGPNDEANAAFIVRAVNCHDDLVAALNQVKAAFSKNDMTEAKRAPWIPGGDARRILTIVDAAIAKAESHE